MQSVLPAAYAASQKILTPSWPVIAQLDKTSGVPWLLGLCGASLLNAAYIILGAKAERASLPRSCCRGFTGVFSSKPVCTANKSITSITKNWVGLVYPIAVHPANPRWRRMIAWLLGGERDSLSRTPNSNLVHPIQQVAANAQSQATYSNCTYAPNFASIFSL